MSEIDDFETVLRSDTPLIDARSPTEFAKGSLPAAVNLPLMNNEEREAVGKCYKAQGQDAAIRLGHELVRVTSGRARPRVADLAAVTRRRTVCFRGGLRSEIAQRWLRMRGWIIPASKVL